VTIWSRVTESRTGDRKGPASERAQPVTWWHSKIGSQCQGHGYQSHQGELTAEIILLTDDSYHSILASNILCHSAAGAWCGLVGFRNFKRFQIC